MDKGLTLLGGMGLGMGLMYLLDPNTGRRRRALVRDKMISAASETGDRLDTVSRDLGNRMTGMFSEARTFFSRDSASDFVLTERVRSKIGRVCSHPSSIEVTARGGHVTLAGPVLAHEIDDILSAVRSVRGVHDVENQMEVYKEAGNIPGLQGGKGRPGERYDIMQSNWAPTTRLAIGSLGGALLAFAFSRRDPLALAFGGVGAGLLARAMTNIETKRLIGAGGGRRAVDLQKTINIAAPVDVVFDFWSDYQNFPLFMRNVSEVRDLGNGRSHWVVAGPAGVPVHWDAVVTRFEPDQILAWKTEPGAPVAHAGIIRFEPMDDDNTRVHIRLSYNPIAGAIGHGLAMLFGADPKSEMDADLMRAKSFIETGKRPRDAAQGVSEQAIAHR